MWDRHLFPLISTQFRIKGWIPIQSTVNWIFETQPYNLSGTANANAKCSVSKRNSKRNLETHFFCETFLKTPTQNAKHSVSKHSFPKRIQNADPETRRNAGLSKGALPSKPHATGGRVARRRIQNASKTLSTCRSPLPPLTSGCSRKRAFRNACFETQTQSKRKRDVSKRKRNPNARLVPLRI